MASVPAVDAGHHHIHRPHFRYGGRRRLLQEAEGQARDCNDGHVRHVQLAAVGGESRLNASPVNADSEADNTNPRPLRRVEVPAGSADSNSGIYRDDGAHLFVKHRDHQHGGQCALHRECGGVLSVPLQFQSVGMRLDHQRYCQQFTHAIPREPCQFRFL